MITSDPWLSYVLGYGVATVLGHFVVGPTVSKLWAVADAGFVEDKVRIDSSMPIHATGTISLWHGFAERAVYGSCVILGKPERIAVWLARKAVIRRKISEVPDPRHVPGPLIYMIDTAMNITFGVLWGFIALGRWSF